MLVLGHTAPSTSKPPRAGDSPSVRQSAFLKYYMKNFASCCVFSNASFALKQSCCTSGKHVACRCTSIGTAVDSGWKDEDFIEVGTLGRPHGIRGEVVVSVDTSFPEERFATPGVRYIQAPPPRGMFVTRPSEAPREVALVSGRPHVTKGNTVWLLRFKEIADRDAAESLRNYKMLIHKSQRAIVDGEDEFYSQDLVGLTVLLYPYHAAAQPSTANLDASEDLPQPALGLDGTVSSEATPDGPEDSVSGRENERLPGSAERQSGDTVTDEDVEDSESEDVAFWDLGKVTDVYDGTGTHGVLRITFSSGLMIQADGALQRVSGDVKGTKESGLLPFARDIVPEIDLDEGVMIVDPPVGWLEMYLTPSIKQKNKRFRKRKSPKTPAVPVVEPEEAVA